jgi:myosin heavy subunit
MDIRRKSRTLNEEHDTHSSERSSVSRRFRSDQDETLKQDKRRTQRLSMYYPQEISSIVPQNFQETDDLILMEDMTDEGILAALKQRYQMNEIFTKIHTGILITMRPAANVHLPVYNEAYKQCYAHIHPHDSQNRLPPHPYELAQRQLHELHTNNISQCIILKGENRSGQSEIMSHLLDYYVSKSCGTRKAREMGIHPQAIEAEPFYRVSIDTPLELRVIAAKKVMDALGCAQTLLGDKSPRYGSFWRLWFHEGDQVRGCALDLLFLEYERIMSWSEGERNFDIFYYLYYGADERQRHEWGLFGESFALLADPISGAMIEHQEDNQGT